MSLSKVIERAQRVQRAHGMQAVSRKTALATMGHQSDKGGAAMNAMSGVLGYGLMETVGDGDVRLSDLGMRVVAGDERSPAAVWEAALRPELHRQLSETYQGDVTPENTALEIHLQEQGFAPKAAGAAAKGYLDAVGYAERVGGIKSATGSGNATAADRSTVGSRPVSGGTSMTISGILYDGNSYALTSDRPVTKDDVDIIARALEDLRRVAPERGEADDDTRLADE